MATTVDDRQFPLVRIRVTAPPDGALVVEEDSYFDAMRRLTKRGRFGAVVDLRELDSFAMPGPNDRMRVYEQAKAFYSEHATSVVAVAMVYHSRMMDMLSTAVGWARQQSPKDSRNSFTDIRAAEDWVLERLGSEALLVPPRVS